MKLALILNIIDSNIGGVLIMGDRGTGKSLAVRALQNLLPDIEVAKNDAFNSSPTNPNLMGPEALKKFQNNIKIESDLVQTPLVYLPLGATEDRVCGTLDIDKALTQAVKQLEPGLLAKANRGILYIDEVNLLEDGIVDMVLDSAASGINTIEREGISLQHPAKFIMIGSGNPQEGEMRPQLLDRFGTSVRVWTIMDSKKRQELVMNRLEFESNPEKYVAKHTEEEIQLRQRILDAQKRLKDVKTPREIKIKVADVCGRLGIEGIRGDLVVNRAARAQCAFEDRQEVTLDDIGKVLKICLTHRLRKDAMGEADNEGKVEREWYQVLNPKAKEERLEAEQVRSIKKQAADKDAKEGKPAAAKDAKAGKEAPKEEKKAGSWSGLTF